MTTPYYLSATTGGGLAPVILTASNALPTADFLTAANPSAANGALGSNYVINNGAPPLVWIPATPLVTTVDTSAADIANAWPGLCIATNPQTGQTLMSMSLTLPTTNDATIVFSAGTMDVTNTTVTVGDTVMTSMTTEYLTVAQGTTTVMTAGAVGGISLNSAVTFGSGVLSDLVVQSSPSATKFQVLIGNSGVSLLTANTNATSVTIGATTNNAAFITYGTGLFSASAGSPTAFSVQDESDVRFNIDTNEDVTTMNTSLALNGAALITEISTEALFVTNGAGTPNTLTFDTTTGNLSVGGAASVAKFTIYDAEATPAPAFRVITTPTANQTDQFVEVTNIQPFANDVFSCGNASHFFTVVYATGGVITTSDERAKIAVEPVAGARCLAAVRQLGAKSFRRSQDGPLELGYSAQELELALADLPHSAVQTNARGLKCVNTEQLVALLLGAVAELARER